jgi:hypothetical protein
MDSTSSFSAVEVESYGLAIGLGDQQEPVCLILSEDSLERGGDVAMSATKASLSGYDLCLRGPKGALVLKNLAIALLEAVHSGLPFVVLNSNTQRDHFIPAIGQ